DVMTSVEGQVLVGPQDFASGLASSVATCKLLRFHSALCRRFLMHLEFIQ
ncbi:Hypothetical predicted protein, partial [Scomber scombrus]